MSKPMYTVYWNEFETGIKIVNVGVNSFYCLQWYHCDLDKLPTSLSSKFIQLNPDQDTIKFLEQSEKKSEWLLTQLWHSLVKLFLGWFMTQTSING